MAGETGEKSGGLYVHWPWCVSKCPYCDFNSHQAGSPDEGRYVAAILRETGHMAERAGFSRLGSLYFGGGTPSLMQADSIAAIIDEAQSHFVFADDIEITLEANPSSSEAEKFSSFAAAGVNRLSLGVQALDDAALKRLGRPHDARTALRALEMAGNCFPRFSFDLIYGRDGQKLAHWERELAQALTLAHDHLSLYQLGVEPGTAYEALARKGALKLPGERDAAAFLELTAAMCKDAGFDQYEISAFARAGGFSRHNLNYWRYGPYAGVGPGAHGRLSAMKTATDMNGTRETLSRRSGRIAAACISNPQKWLEQVERLGHGLETWSELSLSNMADEMILAGMRMNEGLDLLRLEELTGHRIDKDEAARLEREGLCKIYYGDNGLPVRIATAPGGMKLLNHVIMKISLALVAVAAM
jgi:oxygen-independent coproporphyrinogen-3 oxidase